MAEPTVNISFTRSNGTNVSIAGPISDAVLEQIANTLADVLAQEVTAPTTP